MNRCVIFGVCLALMFCNCSLIAAFEYDPELEYRAISLEPPLSWNQAEAMRNFALRFPDDPRAPVAFWNYLNQREFGYERITSTDIPRAWPEREAEWAFLTSNWPEYMGDWRIPFQRARHELGDFFPQYSPQGDIDRAMMFLDEALRLSGDHTTFTWLYFSETEIVPDNAGWPDGPVWPIIKYHQALIFERLALSENAPGYLQSAIEAFETVLDASSLYAPFERDAPMFGDAETRLYRLRRAVSSSESPFPIRDDLFDRITALEIAMRHEAFRIVFHPETVLSVVAWTCSGSPFWLIQIGRPSVELGDVSLTDRAYFAVHPGSGELFRYYNTESVIESLHTPGAMMYCL